MPVQSLPIPLLVPLLIAACSLTSWAQEADVEELLAGHSIHGEAFKWPAMRFAGMPEETLSKHLHLNWDKEPDPDSPFAKLAALKAQLEANKGR